MNSGSGYLKVWLLALICAVLGYGVYAQSGRQYVNPPAPVSKPGKAVETSPVERFDKFKPLPDIADLNQLVDRPLFSQSRRPEIPQPALQAAAQPEAKLLPLEMELTGVMITNKSRIALLKQVRGDKSWQGVIGQIIEGWKIQKIEPNQVVLGQSGTTRILKLVDKPTIKLQRRRDRQSSRRRKSSPLAPPRQPTFNRRAAPEPRTR